MVSLKKKPIKLFSQKVCSLKKIPIFINFSIKTILKFNLKSSLILTLAIHLIHLDRMKADLDQANITVMVKRQALIKPTL